LKQPDKRAFELDALRGLALMLMVLHHFAFDMRYVMGFDIFAFQETWWFENLLRPVFLNVFLIVSGICCSFSRSNTKRGLRLLGVAMLFTVATSILAITTGESFSILFNVLHLLALGTLLYAGLTFWERKTGQKQRWVDVVLLLFSSVVLWFSSLLPHWASQGSYWLLPFGLLPNPVIGMADYLPIIPWLGFFTIGAVIGRQVYASQASAFPRTPEWLVTGSRPLMFVGRNSLLIYALHQPLILAILFGLRQIGLF
jgi:uncharacterized membrane protein